MRELILHKKRILKYTSFGVLVILTAMPCNIFTFNALLYEAASQEKKAHSYTTGSEPAEPVFLNLFSSFRHITDKMQLFSIKKILFWLNEIRRNTILKIVILGMFNTRIRKPLG